MIQTQTNILIKHNSGVLKARCINKRHKPYQKIGGLITTAVKKIKTTFKSKLSKATKLQDVVLIQTKKPIIRYDGSTVAFNINSGVCVGLSGLKLQLEFKRINTMVPFELKKNDLKVTQAGHNLIKLAKTFV